MLDAPVHAVRRKGAVGLTFAGAKAGEQPDRLRRSSDRVDGETALGASFHDVVAQHQMLRVGGWYQHALRSRKSARGADVEEALDLLVDAADRLNLAVLVDRTRDGEILPERRLGERGKQRVEFG